MTLAPVNRQPGIDVARRTVHRLHKKMCEIERLILSQALVVLRNHDFELIALRDNQLSVRFWADANPINAWQYGQRAVGFKRDCKTRAMQRVDQCIVELQHRLAARADDKAPRFVWWPQRGDHRCERVGRSVFTAVLTVKPDEIRITEAAHRARAIFLAARPYVAPPKSAN